MTATAERTVTSLCWCEQHEVVIPVQWVSEGLTGSCGPECGPGCPSRASSATDTFDDHTEVARTGKKTKMKRFNTSKYDPKVDSSFGYGQPIGVRVAHPDAVILETVGGDPAYCPCGCAEAPRGKGATFGMGHDARLRGKLARALAAGSKIVLTDINKQPVEVLDPVDYASRFSTDKLDWAESIRTSASKARRSDDAERAILAKALGPQVGDTKLIKIGRWEKTGKIVAVYQDGKVIRYEYADSNGNARIAEQGEDGKIREVKSA